MKATPLLTTILLAAFPPFGALQGFDVAESHFGGGYSSTQLSPTWTGTLNLGSNTISGHYDGTGDFDYVSVTLPDTLVAVAFTLTTSKVVAAPGTAPASLRLAGIFHGQTGTAPATHALPPAHLVEGGLTTFGIYTSSIGETHSFDYTWEIVTVEKGAISFLESELSVPQTAGQAILRIRYVAPLSPIGSDRLRIRLLDGTATAGRNYGIPDKEGGPLFFHEELPAGRNDLSLVVPVHLLQWRNETFFFVEAERINGGTVVGPISAKITIQAWEPSPWILKKIQTLKKKIRSLQRKRVQIAREDIRRYGRAGVAILETIRHRRIKVNKVRKDIRRLSLNLKELEHSILPLNAP